MQKALSCVALVTGANKGIGFAIASWSSKEEAR